LVDAAVTGWEERMMGRRQKEEGRGQKVEGRELFFSVVIPTYNRLPILEKCLIALSTQTLAAPDRYEVVVVDDGSTDGTVEWLQSQSIQLPFVRLFCQEHLGPAAARNLGVEKALGETIIFIDSDLVVTEIFLQAHADALIEGEKRLQSDRLFTYGRVIDTCDFEQPTAEPYKLTDFSAAYFATGNVAIARHWLEEAGLFDTGFQLYGWEDLELGVRLKQLGLTLIKAPEAVGYHWHPPFNLEQIPRLIDREIQRGRMGVLFYQKHPTWEVKMMIQMTWLHYLLWGVLTLGGTLNERTMAPLLQWLIQRGKPQLALEVARIFLNWYNVQAVNAAYAEQLEKLR
jgi:glycosyltransferase involved in cell wall biosynthesis